MSDCVVWSVFSDSDNACSLKEVVYKGEIYRVRNQLFPFSKAEAETWSGGALSGGDEEEAFFYRWLKGRALCRKPKK